MPSKADILLRATELQWGTPCRLADETPRSGRFHKVFKIVFDDSTEWAARVCEDELMWKREIRFIKHFKYLKYELPPLKAPKVFYLENFPVLYYEWVPGEPLSVWNTELPSEQRQVLLRDLAKFLFLVWGTRTLEVSGEEENPRYSDWLTNSLDRGLCRTLAGTAPWGDAIDYLIMRSMIPKYALGVDIYTHLRYAHGDLNAFNIMVDADYSLTGVVDWDWMYAAPLPAVVHHPLFIADIPGWHNEGGTAEDTFAEDRLFLQSAIEKLEREWAVGPLISQLLADSGERSFFQSAFHLKDIHAAFVERHCKRTIVNMLAASVQLGLVLELYPELEFADGTCAAIRLIESVIGGDSVW